MQVPQSHLHPSMLSVESLQEHRVAEPLGETWDWALRSGRPGSPEDGIPAGSMGGGDDVATGGVEVLLTGHDNGSVSLWDVRSLTPQRLSHVAASARSVTTIELDTVTGLLATGHAGGEVRAENVLQRQSSGRLRGSLHSAIRVLRLWQGYCASTISQDNATGQPFSRWLNQLTINLCSPCMQWRHPNCWVL